MEQLTHPTSKLSSPMMPPNKPRRRWWKSSTSVKSVGRCTTWLTHWYVTSKINTVKLNSAATYALIEPAESPIWLATKGPDIQWRLHPLEHPRQLFKQQCYHKLWLCPSQANLTSRNIKTNGMTRMYDIRAINFVHTHNLLVVFIFSMLQGTVKACINSVGIETYIRL